MMKRVLAFGFAVTAMAACSPAPEPSRDAPGLAVEAAEAPARSAATTTADPKGTVAVAAAEVRPGSLCEMQEQMVWTCQAGPRTISVCASYRLNETEGYVQYRIGRPGALELEYPATRAHPRGRFTFSEDPEESQTLAFRNGGYDYRVFEDLRSQDDGVYVERNGRPVSHIACNAGRNFEPLRTALGA